MININSFFSQNFHEDRFGPDEHGTSGERPFLRTVGPEKHLHLGVGAARCTGTWSEYLSREQLALVLSQVTAAQILPPLVTLPCGSDMLEYQVDLRARLDESLLNEMAVTLSTEWRELEWEQVGRYVYLSVIGSGVAACIDLTPGEERLYLRYSSSLEHEFFLAGRAIDLPRSRLFLQTALYEKFNCILDRVRKQVWCWVGF